MINFIRNYWEVFVIGVLLILALAVQLIIDARRKPGEPRTSEQKHFAKVGDRRYSPFFESDIEIVEYSNDNWYLFRVLEGKRRGQVLRNQSKWSDLPLSRFLPVGHRDKPRA